MTATKNPKVSVIIPTRNSGESMSLTLSSLRQQTYKDFELIVVDDSSKDDTVSVIMRDWPGARIFTQGGERSAQKNLGAREASGELLYFVDSDFAVGKGVIEEAVAACERGYGGALIHNTSDSRVSFWAKVRKLERDCYYRDPKHVACRFVRKEIFSAVGGFDERIVAGEDYDLHLRLVNAGTKLYWCRDVEYHFGEPRTLAEVVRKHVYYGSNILGYVRKQFSFRLRQLSPFRASYVWNLRKLTSDPELMAGFLLYQYVRYASTIFGMLLSAQLPGGTPIGLSYAASSSGGPASLEKLSVVVTTRNRPASLLKCVESLRPIMERGAELVIVDDHSATPYADGYSGMAKVVRNERRQFLAQSRNRGALRSGGEFLLFVDDDNLVGEGAVESMVKLFSAFQNVAVVAPVILTADGRIWYAGGWISPLSALTVFGYRGKSPTALPSRNFDTQLFHSCFMVRRRAFESVGGFDAVNFPMYLGEADLSERLRRKAYRMVVDTSSRVTHEIEVGGMKGMLRNIHITEPVRAYFVARNRILFMRLNRSRTRFLLFLVSIEPTIALVHLLTMISGKAPNGTHLVGAYIRGLTDGVAGREKLGSILLQSRE